MLLLINTATPTCYITTIDNQIKKEYSWDAGRSLAKNILSYIRECLDDNQRQWTDISGIVVFKGPGSFTGLRIGLTVMNTIADNQTVAIVGTTGKLWQQDGLDRLRNGDNDRFVMPLYGADAHITTPRK